MISETSGMPDKKILIHAGFHKTGTSYLQQHLFVNRDAGYNSPADRHELRNAIIRTNPFLFDAAKVRNEFMPAINRSLGKKLVPVLSHEQFTGQPAGSGYGIRRRQREISRKEVADRLYSCFPDANVLIVIREQKEMIKSIYKYFVSGWHGKLSASIEQFLDQSMLNKGYGPLFHLDYLLYHQVIEHYQSLFGRDSVLILPYEWLRDDPVRFINEINRFTGSDPVDLVKNVIVNESGSAALCTLKRYLNRLLVSPDKPGFYSKREKISSDFIRKLNRMVPEKIHRCSEKKLSERISQLTDNLFAESNKKTTVLTGLDLESLGYRKP